MRFLSQNKFKKSSIFSNISGFIGCVLPGNMLYLMCKLEIRKKRYKKMKLSKLQDTFTNEYLIVIDSEGAEVLLQGTQYQVFNSSNFSNYLLAIEVLKVEKLSERTLKEWGLETINPAYVITLDK
jgi:lipoprotein